MEYPHSIFMLKIKQGIVMMITSQRGDLSWFMLRNIYFTKFQSLIRYGIILWGGEIKSVRVLKTQKWVPHAIKGLNKRWSCRPVF